MAIKPTVSGLKAEFPDKLLVVSVDVQSALGRQLAPQYGKLTPTFVFFDAQGAEMWRTIGSLDAAKVRQALQ